MDLALTPIGVRELKATLSACLARVQAGERLTVTDRGRPIATIVPVDEPPWPGWVRTLVGERRAHWAGGRPKGLARPAPARGRSAADMVLEDRR
jgi:prevent-host-death family protein